MGNCVNTSGPTVSDDLWHLVKVGTPVQYEKDGIWNEGEVVELMVKPVVRIKVNLKDGKILEEDISITKSHANVEIWKDVPPNDWSVDLVEFWWTRLSKNIAEHAKVVRKMHIDGELLFEDLTEADLEKNKLPWGVAKNVIKARDKLLQAYKDSLFEKNTLPQLVGKTVVNASKIIVNDEILPPMEDEPLLLDIENDVSRLTVRAVTPEPNIAPVSRGMTFVEPNQSMNDDDEEDSDSSSGGDMGDFLDIQMKDVGDTENKRTAETSSPPANVLHYHNVEELKAQVMQSEMTGQGSAADEDEEDSSQSIEFDLGLNLSSFQSNTSTGAGDYADFRKVTSMYQEKEKQKELLMPETLTMSPAISYKASTRVSTEDTQKEEGPPSLQTSPNEKYNLNMAVEVFSATSEAWVGATVSHIQDNVITVKYLDRQKDLKEDSTKIRPPKDALQMGGKNYSKGDIENLAFRMKKKMMDREMIRDQYRWKIKKFQNVFNGKDAVEVLMILEDLPTEEDAILLATEMLEEGIFSVHSKKDKPFISDDKAFFRFSEQFFLVLEKKRKQHKEDRHEWDVDTQVEVFIKGRWLPGSIVDLDQDRDIIILKIQNEKNNQAYDRYSDYLRQISIPSRDKWSPGVTLLIYSKSQASWVEGKITHILKSYVHVAYGQQSKWMEKESIKLRTVNGKN